MPSRANPRPRSARGRHGQPRRVGIVQATRLRRERGKATPYSRSRRLRGLPRRVSGLSPGARRPGARPPMPGHGRTTVVDLRQVQVVGFAGECYPLRGVVTTHGHRVAVVVFEPVAGRAPSALFDDGGEVGAGDGGAQEGLEPLELVAQPGAGGELDAVAPGGERLDALARGAAAGATPNWPTPFERSSGLDDVASSRRRSGSDGATASGRSSKEDPAICSARGRPLVGEGAMGGRSGSFRMRAGASGRGANSAASSSTWRFERWVARFRTASRLSGVRCGASLAMAVRWSRPSASMARRIGCSRDARAAAMRR
jgi:hypothetical protein